MIIINVALENNRLLKDAPLLGRFQYTLEMPWRHDKTKAQPLCNSCIQWTPKVMLSGVTLC